MLCINNATLPAAHSQAQQEHIPQKIPEKIKNFWKNTEIRPKKPIFDEK